MTKKSVFIVGLGTLIIIILVGLINGESCRHVSEYGHTTDYCGIFAFSILPLLLLIPFSAILYFFHDEVFRAWWNFARWFMPIIIVITFFLSNMGGGGTLGLNGDFAAFILIILYSIFIITSLVKIIRAYLKTREVDNKNY